MVIPMSPAAASECAATCNPYDRPSANNVARAYMHHLLALAANRKPKANHGRCQVAFGSYVDASVESAAAVG